MVSNKSELDEFLQNKMALIEATPARNPQKAADGREVYMNQVKELQVRKSSQLARQKLARKGNRKGFFGWRPSFAPVTIAIALVLILLLGGTWGTAFASQDSLPGDFFYSIKIAGENFRLTFTGNPEAKIDLLSTYSGRRVAEAIQLANRGLPIPENLPARMDTQLEEIFVLAAGMDETSMSQALSGVQIHLRDQDRDMTQAMRGLPEGLDPQLTRLYAMLQARQQLAASGIEDSNTFRHQFRNQVNQPVLTVTDSITSTITTTVTTTITPTLTATPVMTDTLPGQYGPGPCEDPGNCLPPGDGPGPGPFENTPIPPNEQQGYGPGTEQGSGPNLPSATPKPPKENNQNNHKP